MGPHFCWRRSPLGPHLTQNWVPIGSPFWTKMGPRGMWEQWQKKGKVFEQKKLLQPLLGTPEGTKMTCTIFFSCPNSSIPTFVTPSLTDYRSGLHNLFQHSLQSLCRPYQTILNFKMLTKFPNFNHSTLPLVKFNAFFYF